MKLHLLDVFIAGMSPKEKLFTRVWNVLNLVPGVLPVEV